MTIREDIVLFRLFQKQIPLGHPKGAFQKGALQGYSTSHCASLPELQRRKDTIMCAMLGTEKRHRYQYSTAKKPIDLNLDLSTYL